MSGNMASSKSSRASLIPSSFSLSALRPSSTRSSSTSFSTSDVPPGPEPIPEKKHSRRLRKQRLSSRSNIEHITNSEEGELVHSRRPLPKARTWSNRLSSFILPSLIGDNTEFISKKPMASYQQSQPSTSSSTETAPPPYRRHDLNGSDKQNHHHHTSNSSSMSSNQYQNQHQFQNQHRSESSSYGEYYNHNLSQLQSEASQEHYHTPSSSTGYPATSYDQPSSLPHLSPSPLMTSFMQTNILDHSLTFSLSSPTPTSTAVMPQPPTVTSPTLPEQQQKQNVLTKPEPKTKPEILMTTPPSTPGSSQDTPQKTGKLQKENRSRRNSIMHSNSKSSSSSSVAAMAGSSVGARDHSAAAVQGPVVSSDVKSRGRVISEPLNMSNLQSNANQCANNIQGSGGNSPTRGRRRMTWFLGSRSNSNEHSKGNSKPYAWILSEGNHVEYDSDLLLNGEKVPELWNDSGNVLVYLYPEGSGHGPSFRVMDFTVTSSCVFNQLIQSGRQSPDVWMQRGGISTPDEEMHYHHQLHSPPRSPPPGSPGDLKLYLPAAPALARKNQSASVKQNANAERDRLIAVRNLFAFLTGQPLVATKTHSTTLQIFIQISALLEEFGFTSPDGVGFGNAVDLSFEFYLEQLGLTDCRHSRERTIEALILGERMRSMDLYNEAFAHAAGKYSAIMDLRSPLFNLLSAHTRQQLEKSHFDLIQRQHNVNEHLEQFEFPSLFAGIANSTSMTELKQVRFAIWKKSFNRMRTFVLCHYKTTFGNWPPKASSSKNPFAESGLNRLVLRTLYSDMCLLYDLLVDRKSLTSRVMDEVPALSHDPDKMIVSALRNIMSEFDRSRPPVLPPVPYDLPQLPAMTSIFEAFNELSSKEQVRFEKKIKEHELNLVLNKAYNYDTSCVKNTFLDHFKTFELREGRGKMAADLVDQRIGYWLFLYVIVQSLPMLVIDAPDLKFTEGTEYFLCQPPMGNPPWMEDRQVRKMWYEVAGGGGLVELSTDAVLFSVEATYHRSHCWLAAKAWEGAAPVQQMSMIEEPPMPDLLPPSLSLLGHHWPENTLQVSPPLHGIPTPPSTSPHFSPRAATLSPGGNRASQAYRSSIAIGLEPVPMEPRSPFNSGNYRSSSYGPRPMSTALGIRNNRSASNLMSMDETPGSTVVTMPVTNTGATFDDILAEHEKKPSKKKGFFF